MLEVGDEPGGQERLHKRIANAGICSRRAGEKLIAEGRVSVNGKVVTQMGVMVSPDDDVRVDSKLLPKYRLLSLAMNKPKGILTTMDDPQKRPTVAQLLPNIEAVLKPVGRLDRDTEGLLLFTNDGDLAMRLTHPRYGVEKEYRVMVTGEPSEKLLDKLRKGIYIEGGRTSPAVVSRDPHKGNLLTMVIHEGRNRQIRKMCEAIGHPAIALKRVRIGSISLHKLPTGACRMLGKIEVDVLRKAVGLPPT